MDTPDKIGGRLTADLLKAGPEESKELLDQALMEHPEWESRMRIPKFRELMHPVKVKNNTWISLATSSTIFLGGRQMPFETKNDLIYRSEDFDYHDEISYRYGHEVCHALVFFLARCACTEDYKTLFNTTLAMRRNMKSRGLTALGSYPFYQNQGEIVQASEDLIELTNMYLWDPEYFKEFLRFLCNRDLMAMGIKNSRGLITINEDVAGVILKTVENSLKLSGF